ncbi:MAG: site-2 protease family protein [Spirochaetes bacterium]|nr:site-2 protease family protein [Spirochaetota bacterium]
MNYFIIIALIGMLIFIHELGHFIFAKLTGIPVAVFSIGFGPKIWKYKAKETEYCISVIPLGGYILPAIENESEFYQIPVIKRILFSIGGPLANILLPIILLIFLNIFSSSASFSAILLNPFIQVSDYFINIVMTIPVMFTSPDHLSGIVGIVNTGSQFIASGIRDTIKLLILLSLNLAVFNLLPIPALDGGKIILYFLEKIHPKLLKIQIPATIAGWLIITGLMVYVTVNDVVKIFA